MLVLWRRQSEMEVNLGWLAICPLALEILLLLLPLILRYFIFCVVFFLFFGFIYFLYFQFGMYFPFCPTSEGVAARIAALLGIVSGEVLIFFFFFFFSSPSHIPPSPKGQQHSGQMWRTRPRPSSLSWRARLHLPRPHLHHHPCDSFSLPSGISPHHRESGDCF